MNIQWTTVNLGELAAAARADYDAAWEARVGEWRNGIFRHDIGEDG